MKKSKENKGITLIALVITIIVLLILAGVTIATLNGENGILTQANKASEQSKSTNAKEKVQVEVAGSFGIDGKLNGDNLKKNLGNIDNISGIPDIIEKASFPLKLTVDDDYLVIVYEDGKVSDSFNKREWDKTASDEDCFIWQSDTKGEEGYNTVIGYTAKIESYTKLRFPSRCTKIEFFTHGVEYDGVDATTSRGFTNNILKVEIPGTVNSIGINAFGAPVDKSFQSLEEVTMQEGIRAISSNAFDHCENLKSIVIPDSLTNIANSAFNNTAWYNDQPDGVVYVGKVVYKYKGIMPSDVSIEIKEGTIVIADHAFYGCENLKSIIIPNSVTSIGYEAFRDCTSLTNINIPEGVTYIGGFAFCNCKTLESIIIPDGVINIQDAVFYNWTSIQTINCKSSSQPSGWHTRWNIGCNAKIVWGYTGE